MTLTREQGSELVQMARNALEGFVMNDKITIPDRWDNDYLNEKRGVFVTLNRKDGSLRGCVGFPLPTKPLGAATIEATVAAAAKDPRFPRVEGNEVPNLSVEVSVLTEPEVISVPKPTEYPGSVRVGEDGLIISAGSYSGLLLPQVATEFGLGPEDFLSETCVKAGLMPDAWLSGRVVVQKFQTEIFSEEAASEKVSEQSR
ncbi:MAG: TIGR00296 family protein [Thaumarchaeota archaeon]|nr:TIGR00296 family protein [Nitrososphaerota archaeon]MCS4540186.1 TIGR00296 family protein [Nitrososphaerota archaeon]